jgi:hypothetical protein
VPKDAEYRKELDALTLEPGKSKFVHRQGARALRLAKTRKNRWKS